MLKMMVMMMYSLLLALVLSLIGVIGHLSPFKSSINRLASRFSNFTSSSSSGDDTATNSIPIQGVKLSHLISDFYVACGGREKLKGLSTTEVSRLYVKPDSYCWSVILLRVLERKK